MKRYRRQPSRHHSSYPYEEKDHRAYRSPSNEPDSQEQDPSLVMDWEKDEKRDASINHSFIWLVAPFLLLGRLLVVRQRRRTIKNFGMKQAGLSYELAVAAKLIRETRDALVSGEKLMRSEDDGPDRRVIAAHLSATNVRDFPAWRELVDRFPSAEPFSLDIQPAAIGLRPTGQFTGLANLQMRAPRMGQRGYIAVSIDMPTRIRGHLVNNLPVVDELTFVDGSA